jgi:hypothetical protein
MAIVAVGPGGRTASTPLDGLAEDVELQPFTSPQGLTGPPASQQASLLGDSFGDTRMNAYLLRHYQATGASGVKGFITFVPIVVRPAGSMQESPDAAASASQKTNGEDTAKPQ